MYLLPDFAVPVSASRIYRVLCDTATGTTIVPVSSGSRTASPIVAGFKATYDGSNWHGEGEIPLSALGIDAKSVNAGDRWRLNAALHDRKQSGKDKILATWGFYDEKSVQHGIVLEFAGE